MAKVLTDNANYTDIADAIRTMLGVTDTYKPDEMAEAILSIENGNGTGTTEYVVGSPVSFTLSDWDADVQGTTYELTCEGYTIGDYGVQLGLPDDSSTVNTLAVVEAALSIVNASVSDTTSVLTINAVTAPTQDLTVAIFGLEEAENDEDAEDAE